MIQKFLAALNYLHVPLTPLRSEQVEANYKYAQEMYGTLGIDTEAAMAETDKIRVSTPCWAVDMVTGYEKPDPHAKSEDSGASGLQASEKVQGMPRTLEEHLEDLKAALSMIPGLNGVLVHNIYANTDKYVPRNEHQPEHFRVWVDWAKANNLHLHMNPSPFNHPMANSGMTLSSSDDNIRKYWIQEIQNTRKIAEFMGMEQNSLCIHNIWIPDGAMDARVDRTGPRKRLLESLKECLNTEYPWVGDAVEGKLFGHKLEDYVVGSHEFYADFSAENGCLLCIDTGHFTHMDPNQLADKVGSYLVSENRKGILMHVSFPRYWDCDFVPRTSDWLNAIADEVKRSGKADKVYWGNDFFQHKAHPIAALVLGGRTTRKAILHSYLDPYDMATRAENEDETNMLKLALAERRKELPFGAVWDMYCLRHEVPVGMRFLEEVGKYDRDVRRGRH